MVQQGTTAIVADRDILAPRREVDACHMSERSAVRRPVGVRGEGGQVDLVGEEVWWARDSKLERAHTRRI